MKSNSNNSSFTPIEQRFVATLEKLLTIPSPPGYEERMAKLIQSELENMGYHPEIDPSGNLVLTLTGESPTASHIMIAAHMDEIAIAVRSICNDGTLRVARSGRLLPFKSGERPFLFLGDKQDMIGVVSLGSGHSNQKTSSKEWEDIPVITGCSIQELKNIGIRPGTPAVPTMDQRGPIFFGSKDNPLIGAWTLDDRAGAAVLIEWLRDLKQSGKKPFHPITVVWTVHEEGGCLGAVNIASRIRPDIFIAIDGAPWTSNDEFMVNEHPVAWSKDKLTNYDRTLLTRFNEVAKEVKTELQYAVLETAYSDASRVYHVGASPRAGVLGHPRFNSHGYEVARLAVFPAMIHMLDRLFTREID